MPTKFECGGARSVCESSYDGLATAWRDTFVFAVRQRSSARCLTLVSQTFLRVRSGRGVVSAIDWLLVSLFDCSLSFCVFVHTRPPVG
ncbi:hypothetical protein J2Z84_003947 [Agrobacterium rubi]|nr:hypothetical protein [Agrobacterium rubi]